MSHLCAVLVLAATSVSVGVASVDFGHANEKSFSATVGRPFQVRLEACHDCGLNWELEEKLDGVHVEGPTRVQEESGHKRKGGNDLYQFTLVVEKTLKADVRFVMKRSWEKSPYQTAVLHLTATSALAIDADMKASVDFGDASEKSFSATVGKPFQVRLEACHGCGFTWMLEDGLDGVHVQGPTHVKEGSQHKGGNDLYEFTLVVERTLNTDVRFVMKRSWEKSPSQTAVLHLTATSALAMEADTKASVDFGDSSQKSFSATVGRPFLVRLEACHGCGFTWMLEDQIDGVHIQGPTHVKEGSQHKGGNDLYEFTLVVERTLNADVRFVMKRSWEKSPYQTAVLHLAATSALEMEANTKGSVDFGDSSQKTFSATVGRPFLVRLEACHGCGFTWMLEDQIDGVHVQGPTHVKEGSQHKGGNDVYEFTLVVENAIKADVRFVKKRSWEKSPYQTAVLHLTAASALQVADAKKVKFLDRTEKSAAIIVGEPLLVQLEGCHGCGFAWTLAGSPRDGLRVDGPSSLRNLESTKGGEHALYTFSLVAEKPLLDDVRFVYQRPWDTRAQKTAVLHLTVTGATIVLV